MSYGSALIYDFDCIIKDLDEFTCEELEAIRKDTRKFLYEIEMTLRCKSDYE